MKPLTFFGFLKEFSMAEKLPPPSRAPSEAHPGAKVPPKSPQKTIEIGGPAGPEPTRYSDWERGGKCVDF